MGLTIPTAPRTNKIFAMLDPIIFPMASGILSKFIACIDAANSGKLVHNATIVNPTK